jgi:hypothetical protein
MTRKHMMLIKKQCRRLKEAVMTTSILFNWCHVLFYIVPFKPRFNLLTSFPFLSMLVFGELAVGSSESPSRSSANKYMSSSLDMEGECKIPRFSNLK